MNKKIDALERTIYNLEKGVYAYSWGSSNSCNCGILARTLMNGDLPFSQGLRDIVTDDGGVLFSTRYHRTVEKCESTGIPLPRVFQVLKDAGFTPDELNELENFSQYKDEVIKYMKVWVKQLKIKEYPDATADILKDFKESPESVDIVKQIVNFNF